MTSRISVLAHARKAAHSLAEPRPDRAVGSFRTLSTSRFGLPFAGGLGPAPQPFPIRVPLRPSDLCAILAELNDIGGRTHMDLMPEQFSQMIRDRFDLLYEEGERSCRVMAIALHPDLPGHPFRARWLDRTHDYISGHPHVWHATGSEIADCYYAHYYEGAPE